MLFLLLNLKEQQNQEDHEALAEDPTLDTLVKWGQAREMGREDNTSASRVNRIESTPELDMDSDEIEEMMQTLKAMKLRKEGRYSSRYKAKPKKGPCRNCSTEHPVGRCPANGKTCFGCGSINHFSRALACPKRSVKKIQEDPSNLGYRVHSSFTDTELIHAVGRVTNHEDNSKGWTIA